MIRKAKNRSAINFARKNAELIKECASFAISVTLDSKTNSFAVEDIKDKNMRRKISSLGTETAVAYSSGGYYEIPDSIVTFKSITLLMGVTEIVYDFASRERSFSNDGARNGDYYFVKVADRIYYRKRAFPMM